MMYSNSDDFLELSKYMRNREYSLGESVELLEDCIEFSVTDYPCCEWCVIRKYYLDGKFEIIANSSNGNNDVLFGIWKRPGQDDWEELLKK